MGDTTTIPTITIISPPPGVRNFGFSISALCVLRDVEKETHKHKVFWEKTNNNIGSYDKILSDYMTTNSFC